MTTNREQAEKWFAKWAAGEDSGDDIEVHTAGIIRALGDENKYLTSDRNEKKTMGRKSLTVNGMNSRPSWKRQRR